MYKKKAAFVVICILIILLILCLAISFATGYFTREQPDFEEREVIERGTITAQDGRIFDFVATVPSYQSASTAGEIFFIHIYPQGEKQRLFRIEHMRYDGPPQVAEVVESGQYVFYIIENCIICYDSKNGQYDAFDDCMEEGWDSPNYKKYIPIIEHGLINGNWYWTYTLGEFLLSQNSEVAADAIRNFEQKNKGRENDRVPYFRGFLTYEDMSQYCEEMRIKYQL